MENNVWEILKAIIASYIIYLFIITFLITTFSHFTYRFWKMLLSKEEKNIFLTNTPIVWHLHDENWNKKKYLLIKYFFYFFEIKSKFNCF